MNIYYLFYKYIKDNNKYLLVSELYIYLNLMNDVCLQNLWWIKKILYRKIKKLKESMPNNSKISKNDGKKILSLVLIL